MNQNPIVAALLCAAFGVSGCASTTSHATPMVAPDEALAANFYSAIWGDLQSNALIGNGALLVSQWMNAGHDRGESPELHIQHLVCDGGSTRRRCEFGLLRDGGVAEYLGEPVPDRLLCEATFRRSAADGVWAIPQLPPTSRGGHGRITIQCRPAV